jgi:hypothetical protein
MKVELYVLIDADEGVWVHTDPSELADGDTPTNPTRLLSICLDVPAPELVELEAVIPAEALPNVACQMTVKG